MKYTFQSQVHSLEERKRNYWRGFRVGLALGLMYAGLLLIILK